MKTIIIPKTPRSESAQAAIDRLLGVGISHHGRFDRDGTVDCVGGMLATHTEGGLVYDHTPFNQPYTLWWFRACPSRLIDGMRGLGWEDAQELREMDVCMAATVTLVGDHPLVYVGNGEVFHAANRLRGMALDPLSLWLPRIKAILRPKAQGS